MNNYLSVLIVPEDLDMSIGIKIKNSQTEYYLKRTNSCGNECWTLCKIINNTVFNLYEVSEDDLLDVLNENPENYKFIKDTKDLDIGGIL